MSRRQEKRRKEKKGWGERRKTTEKQEAKSQEIICLRSIGQSNLLGTEHKLEIRYIRVIWNKSKIERGVHVSCGKAWAAVENFSSSCLFCKKILFLFRFYLASFYFHFIYPVKVQVMVKTRWKLKDKIYHSLKPIAGQNAHFRA